MASKDRSIGTTGQVDPDYDESALTPEQMLKLVDEQQNNMLRQQLSPIPWMLAVWGIAWLVGFLLLWSAAPGGNPWLSIPGPVAGIAFAVLISSAIALSATLGIRIGRGVQGGSAFAGTVYGISWVLCGTAFAAVGVALIRNGLSSELASLYFPSVFALLTGTLYLAGAALWHQKSQLVLGIILLVTGSIAPFFGAPSNNLVMALFGGGSLLAAAVMFGISLRRMAQSNG